MSATNTIHHISADPGIQSPSLYRHLEATRLVIQGNEGNDTSQSVGYCTVRYGRVPNVLHMYYIS